MHKNSKNHLDFNLDLIPVISLFSVCICFLLLTAVWVQVGAIDVKQALGGQAQSETERRPMLSIKMLPSGDLEIEPLDFLSKKGMRQPTKITLKNVFESPEVLTQFLSDLQAVDPEFRGATIEPFLDVEYEKIVYLMDLLRAQGVVDLGVVTL